MKTLTAASVVWLLFAGIAAAQVGPSSADAPAGYVGIVGQSAFGNVTSQSFGVEGGWAVMPSFVVFGEAGRVLDAAPASVGDAAQLIAGAIQQANVAFKVKEPITFFAAGVKYVVWSSGKLQPYLLAGFGLAQVKPNVEFTVGGTNVNGTLDQFGIVLGSDLSGTSTKPMMEVGAGAVYPLGDRVYADAEFRYNRVFIPGAAIPFSRAGLGLGLRF
jgi:hypothetical protein